MLTRHCLLSAGTAVLLVLSRIQVGAADWVGDEDQDWNNGLNWSANVYPAGQSVAVNIETGNFPIIWADTMSVIDTLVGSVNGSAGRLDHPAGLHSTGLHNWTFVGINGGTGTYNLADTSASGAGLTGFAQGTGSLYYGDRFYIGRNGGNGTLNVNTTGTLSAGLFLVGIGGQGTVRFESGTITAFENHIGGNESAGNLASGGGTGTASMSGGTWNTTNRASIGDGTNTTGTVNMTGGTWNHNHTGTLSLGLRDGSGTLVMSGSSVLNDQSVVDTSTRATNKGNVVLGLSGTGASTGTVTLNDNSVARVRYLGVAEAAGTTGIVNMNGSSSLTLSQDFVVGQRGTGTANLNGGTVNLNTGWTYIGGFAGATGVVNLSGGSIKALTGGLQINVGHGGAGTLTVSGTGRAEGLNRIAVAILAGSSGTVQLNGGTVQVAGFLIGAGTANVNFNGGTVRAMSSNTNFFNGHTTGNSELQAGGLVFDTNGFNPVANNSFDGNGGITKIGAGTLTLSNASTYTGSTTVNAGVLNVTNTTGSATGTGTVTIGSTSTLAGTGFVTAGTNNSIHVNGTLQVGSAGDTTGVNLNLATSGTGSTVLGASSIVRLDLFSGAGLGDQTGNTTAADMIHLSGDLGISTGATLKLGNPNNLSAWAAGDQFSLFDWTALDVRTGTWVVDDTDLQLPGGLIGTFTHSTGIYSIDAVPEPGRALLMLMSLGVMWLRRRRRSAFQASPHLS